MSKKDSRSPSAQSMRYELVQARNALNESKEKCSQLDVELVKSQKLHAEALVEINRLNKELEAFSALKQRFFTVENSAIAMRRERDVAVADLQHYRRRAETAELAAQAAREISSSCI